MVNELLIPSSSDIFSRARICVFVLRARVYVVIHDARAVANASALTIFFFKFFFIIVFIGYDITNDMQAFTSVLQHIF